jgi:hypothetical protein
MKRLQYLYVSFLILLVTACGGDKKESLARTWQVSNIETESELVDSVKNAMLMSSTLQFTENGEYLSSGGIGVDQGTYTIDEDGKTLSTVSSAGRNDAVYTIEELDEDELVLTTRGTTFTCKPVN